MTIGKTIVLTRQTFVGNVISLLFNILSSLVITFLSSKEQASFNFMVSVTICSDFGAKKVKSVTISIVSYRGPAPLESGVSKGRRLWRSGYDRIKDIKSEKDSSVRKFSGEKGLNNLVYVES